MFKTLMSIFTGSFRRVDGTMAKNIRNTSSTILSPFLFRTASTLPTNLVPKPSLSPILAQHFSSRKISLPFNPSLLHSSCVHNTFIGRIAFNSLNHMQIVRHMNRNARRPKAANHGKRPVCNARRRAKDKMLKSRAYKEKIFGFW